MKTLHYYFMIDIEDTNIVCMMICQKKYIIDGETWDDGAEFPE